MRIDVCCVNRFWQRIFCQSFGNRGQRLGNRRNGIGLRLDLIVFGDQRAQRGQHVFIGIGRRFGNRIVFGQQISEDFVVIIFGGGRVLHSRCKVFGPCVFDHKVFDGDQAFSAGQALGCGQIICEGGGKIGRTVVLQGRVFVIPVLGCGQSCAGVRCGVKGDVIKGGCVGVWRIQCGEIGKILWLDFGL